MKFVEMAKLPCRTCGGTKQLRKVVATLSRGGLYFPEPLYEHQICSDCLQNSKPTGLLLPELSLECRPCGGKGLIKVHDPQTTYMESWEKHNWGTYHCGGTGRIPLQGDLLQAAGERVLNRHGTWEYRRHEGTNFGTMHGYTIKKLDMEYIETDRMDALEQALSALLEADKSVAGVLK
jgi:hypothetical protein